MKYLLSYVENCEPKLKTFNYLESLAIFATEFIIRNIDNPDSWLEYRVTFKKDSLKLYRDKK